MEEIEINELSNCCFAEINEFWLCTDCKEHCISIWEDLSINK